MSESRQLKASLVDFRLHVEQGIDIRLLRTGDAALDMHRIEIHVATQNHRSRRIPERPGFTLEGVMHGVQRLRDQFLDHALYAAVHDEQHG